MEVVQDRSLECPEFHLKQDSSKNTNIYASHPTVHTNPIHTQQVQTTKTHWYTDRLVPKLKYTTGIND